MTQEAEHIWLAPVLASLVARPFPSQSPGPPLQTLSLLMAVCRRFQLQNAWRFEDYDDAALLRIMKGAAKKR